ncbi:chemotaxis protein CheW [Limnoglobus roseus]|uniref:Chemotaxis protein CheW n=1 Tax=Limnoglobus roseus TaxID=2598579 RepID=A0A5C1A8W0_9BACT|nr:chemotaxis protein CheW [Limnoglobus roseus]QEL13538.1 chemotaxis protein CheW [Limnoglobus roseus]
MLLLTFQIGPEAVGLDIRRVREVIPRVRLQRPTGGPAWLAGVFVYHGRVVPVIDLHQLAGHAPCPHHLSSRIILLPVAGDAAGEHLYGILAAQVADLREVPDGVPAMNSLVEDGGIDLGSTVADGGGVLRLLDPERMLPAAARRQILLAAGVPA